MEVLRKYNQATTILFPLIDFGATDFEDTPVAPTATGDCVISKDEGAFTDTDSDPAHEGNGIYSLALTATEMQAARIVIAIIDQTATKLWEDQCIIISTYGNASATHAFDLDTASTAQTGDSFARIGVAGASLTDLGGMSTGMKGEVEAECDDALIAKGLDHLVFTSVIGTDVADNSIIARMVSKSATADWDTFDNTNDSAEGISDRLPASLTGGRISANIGAINGLTATVTNLEDDYDGTGYAKTNSTIGTCTTLTNKTDFSLSAAGIDAIIDETLTSHVTADSLGVAIKDILADTGTDGVVVASGSKTGYALSATGIDAILDETLTSHVTADSLAVAVKDILEDTGTSGVITASGTVTTVSGNVNGSVDSVTNAVGSVTGAVGSVTAGVSIAASGIPVGAFVADSITASALADDALAEINAEVVDVMNTDTITLPGQVNPPASPTHRQAIGWLYKVLRNKTTQTATTWTLRDDGDTQDDATATVSDDTTTFTRGEIVAGT